MPLGCLDIRVLLPLSPFGGPVVTSAAPPRQILGVGSKWQARRLARRNDGQPAQAGLPGPPARASPSAGYCRGAGRSSGYAGIGPDRHAIGLLCDLPLTDT